MASSSDSNDQSPRRRHPELDLDPHNFASLIKALVRRQLGFSSNHIEHVTFNINT